jgi:hypothetical protein
MGVGTLSWQCSRMCRLLGKSYQVGALRLPSNGSNRSWGRLCRLHVTLAKCIRQQLRTLYVRRRCTAPEIMIWTVYDWRAATHNGNVWVSPRFRPRDFDESWCGLFATRSANSSVVLLGESHPIQWLAEHLHNRAGSCACGSQTVGFFPYILYTRQAWQYLVSTRASYLRTRRLGGDIK